MNKINASLIRSLYLTRRYRAAQKGRSDLSELSKILAQLPADYEVTIKPKQGTAHLGDLAGELLRDDGTLINLDDYELITKVYLPGDPPADAKPIEPDENEMLIQQELSRLRIRSVAQQRLRVEQQPPSDPPVILTLEDRLKIDHPPLAWRIEGWQPANTRVLLAAQYKAGKTTITGNLARSLADSDPWLEQSAVTPVLKGQVTILDFEMSERQIDGWLSDQNIKHTDRVTVIPLRGKATTFNILDEQIRAEWAERLTNTEYLIVDCLRPALDGLGLDEHREAGRFLIAYDSLCEQAGIDDSLIVHHMGHSEERSRGDSRLRDWPDVEWRLVRENDNPASPRFMSAFGRDVEVDEGQLSYDPMTRHVAYRSGSRMNAAARGAITDILEMLGEVAEPLTKKAIEIRIRNEYGHTQKIVRDGLEIAIHSGQILVEKGDHGAHLCTPAGQLVAARQKIVDEVPGQFVTPLRGGNEVDPEVTGLENTSSLPLARYPDDPTSLPEPLFDPDQSQVTDETLPDPW